MCDLGHRLSKGFSSICLQAYTLGPDSEDVIKEAIETDMRIFITVVTFNSCINKCTCDHTSIKKAIKSIFSVPIAENY